LDEIFAEKIDPNLNLDAVESKLFGIGSESYVVGSHEFYFGYAVARQKQYCLDTGHFHPTESLADKVSSMLQFVPGLLLHRADLLHPALPRLLLLQQLALPRDVAAVAFR